MQNPYTFFRNTYPKDIQLATLIFAIHMLRKTIFNNSGGAVMMLCIVLNLYIILKNSQLLTNAIKGTKAFIIYCSFAFISILWAIEKDYMTVWGKDIEILVAYMAVATIIYKIRNAFLAYYYVIVLVSLSTAMGMARGLMQGAMHTNVYSLTALVGFILAYNIWRHYKIPDIKIFIYFNLFALIIGTSSASYIAAIFAFLILLMFTRKGISTNRAIMISLGALLIFLVAENVIMHFVFYNKSEKLIETGSGRDYIWEVFVNAWKKSPWIGWGYSVAERNMELFEGGREGYLSAHNGYLSLLVNTGIVGFVFYSPIFIRTCWNAIRFISQNKGEERILCIGGISAFAGVLINNYTYPILGSDWNYGFTGIIALVVLLNTIETKIYPDEDNLGDS